MGKIDVERKRKTVWPLVIGAGLLVLIFWGVTTLLTEDPDEGPQVTVPTVEDTYPPASVPAPPDLPPSQTGVDQQADTSEAPPLDEETVGQTVRLQGEVVATGNDAFWILARNEVVGVESPRVVRKGDTVAIAGIVRPADPARTDRIAEVLERHPAAEVFSVVRAVKLVENESGLGAAGMAAARSDA